MRALFERWGFPAVFVAAAIVLLAGLGSAGLWEPWEMDRADLARTLADPPQAAFSFAADSSQQLASDFDEAARRAGVVARRAGTGGLAGRGAQTSLRTALDMARTQVLTAVVLDMALLLPDPDKNEAWSAAARKVTEAVNYVPNGLVILVEQREGISVDEVRTKIAEAQLRELWKAQAPAYGLDKLPGATGFEAAIHSQATPDPRLRFLVRPSAQQIEGVMAEAASGHAAIVRFKDRGDTIAVPPLEAWLRTAAYKALGPTEFSTRLPGVLLCLVALWVMMLTVRSLWGTRPAVLAGLVLLTTPLFYAQARSAAGESGALLGLTLTVCGLLLHSRGAGVRLVWSYLLFGVLVGFLAKGLFALLLFGTIAASVPLITGARRLKQWLPAMVLLGLLALAALWVLGQPADGFAGQFRFTNPLFSSGPSDYHRNFDLLIRQIGFGSFPWSPIIVVAVGAMVFYAPERRDPSALLVILWFALPVVITMAMLKDYNQLVWPAAPAAAIAVALLFEQILTRGLKSYYVALAVFVMTLLLTREVLKSPEPLVSFLTVDPPFADKGNLRFPEALTLPSLLGLAALGAGAVASAYFANLLTFAKRALRFFKRERPFAIALGVVMVLPPIYWLSMVGSAHRSAIGAARGAGLGQVVDSQRAFLSDFSPAEPTVLLLILTALALLAAALGTWVLPEVGRKVAAVLKPLVRIGPRWLSIVGAAIWVGLGLRMVLWVSEYPDDFWGETLLSAPSLAGYAAAACIGLVVWRLCADRVVALASSAGVVGLMLALRIARDAGFDSGVIPLVVALGWLALALTLVPPMLRRPERFAVSSGVILAVLLLAIVVPMLDRYTWVEHALYPGTGGTMTRRLLVASRGAWICYLAIGVLLVNRRFHDLFAPYARRIRAVETGPVTVGALTLAALAVTVGTTFGFHSELSYNVSQKHLIDTYFEADNDADARKRIFKHGAFASQGRKDANFYTAGIPEIRDRQTALKVLLGQRDQVASLETSQGTESRFLGGFNPANDADGDGRRDSAAITGFATAVSGQTITDATQRLPPDSLVGYRLVDLSGRSWPVVANTRDSITVESRSGLPISTASAAQSFYAVDLPDAADHRATAQQRERRALLVPALSLSELNHAFRRLSGGRHLPVVDGRSYRVVLATSWLNEGEAQQNRLANATYTQASFDELADPNLVRVWGNFDDTIQVVGYTVDKPMVSSGQTFTLTVYYKALKRIDKSYKIFLHIDRIGGDGRIHGDHWPLNPTKHSEDNKNCGGCYRTDHWMPGDIVADSLELEVPSGHNSGDHNIWLGFFTPGSDKRLKLKSWDEPGGAKHDNNNRLSVGRLQVR